MRFDLNYLTIVSIVYALVSCGKSTGNSKPPVASLDFPDSLISEFSSWSPVLNGDLAFASSGHSGQTVRVYFNDIAKPYFTGEKELPFAPGSLVAKAVVASIGTSAKDASKVYFMRKKDSGFDSGNADWSYAQTKGSAGSLSFSDTTGAISGCFSCHSIEKTWDYVRTVQYHKSQVVSE